MAEVNIWACVRSHIAYWRSSDGLQEQLCWWIAERVPPRLARAIFTRVSAVVDSPYRRFPDVWNAWSKKHELN